MNHRLNERFDALRASGRKALIPFVTAGDPHPDVTVPLMHAMVQAGADVIELGVPFSDPMADGPVIQKASERALQHHVSLRDVLAMVREFRAEDGETPVVLMGYLNPIEVMGHADFAAAAAAAGVDGVLTVDCPPEESASLVGPLGEHRIAPIYLLAPTSDERRIRKICAVAEGFVYYVSMKGVTGASHLDLDSVAGKLAGIRRHTDLPLGVGFGIKDAETAAAIGRLADAVIVGSALVRLVAENADRPDAIPGAVGELLYSMRQALDRIGAEDRIC